jgi:hypothetical protein
MTVFVMEYIRFIIEGLDIYNDEDIINFSILSIKLIICDSDSAKHWNVGILLSEIERHSVCFL